MVFASPIFLFLFLPATLAAYFVAPRRWRNAVLLAASVVFYAWGEARYLLLICGSVAFNFAIGLRIAGAAQPLARRRWLDLAVAGNLAALLVFKYAGLGIALPLGISFFTFHAISYVVDVYERDAEAQTSLADFALYILAFPQLVAGPIIRWRDIAAQIGRRRELIEDFAWGARRFVLGLGKKVLVANPLGQVADVVFALPAAELTTPLAWLGLACYTLQIYFDFSGYSDMAIGLLRMFGFRVAENFDYPYISRSVREFWRRWHISLSNWFRNYVYIRLGGSRGTQALAWRNLVIVFLLCGLWHGASWTFVLWGAWHGAFLVIERAGFSRLLARIGPLAHLYALAATMGGWVLFRCESLPQAAGYYAALLGFAHGDPLAYPVARLLDPWVTTTLAAGILGAMPLARVLGAWRERAALPGGAAAAIVHSAEVLLLAAVALGAAALLAAGGYNPFIYFRF